jgi:hypothetical protein
LGYLKRYTADEESILYAATANNGSPLLRIGEEDALMSVGLNKEKLRFKENCKKEKEALLEKYKSDDAFDTLAENDRAPPSSSAASRDGKMLEHFPCSNVNCQRMLKVGCLHNCCKRCCDKRFQQTLLESLGENIDRSQFGKMFASHTNPCPVHKIKEKQLKKLQSKHQKLGSENIEESSQDKVEAVDAAELNNENDTGGASHVKVCSVKNSYVSTCKALLVGLGADEQLAGYGRHRTTFLQGGYEALCDEMNKDLSRLWQRNLGRLVTAVFIHVSVRDKLLIRDDRCVADHGREAWFPYLDEEFVEYIQSIPLSIVSRFRNLNC